MTSGGQIELARGDFDIAQIRKDSEGYKCDLIGSLIFSTVDFDLSFGRITFGISKCALALHFYGCQMKQLEQGFRKAGNVSFTQIVTTSDSNSGSKGKEFQADLGATLHTESASGKLGFKNQKTYESVRKETLSTESHIPLVSAQGVSQEGVSEYIIENPLGKTLRDDVLLDDVSGGFLGVLRIKEKASWSCHPEVQLLPTCDVVDTSKLSRLNRLRFNKRLREKRTLAAIVLEKEYSQFDHVDLPSLGSHNVDIEKN